MKLKDKEKLYCPMKGEQIETSLFSTSAQCKDFPFLILLLPQGYYVINGATMSNLAVAVTWAAALSQDMSGFAYAGFCVPTLSIF